MNNDEFTVRDLKRYLQIICDKLKGCDMLVEQEWKEIEAFDGTICK